MQAVSKQTRNFIKDAVAVLLLVSFAWLLLYQGIKNEYKDDIQSELQESVAKQEIAWSSVQKLFDEGQTLRFESIIYQPEVLQILQRAQEPSQQQQARIELYRLLYPFYKARMQELGDKFNLHFHTADNRSFLRFHKPEYFGDDLSQIRPTVVQANRTQQEIHAFESGRTQSSYHHTFPINYNGVKLGTVEFGQQFETLRKTMLEFAPDSEYSIIFHGDRLEQKRSKPFAFLYAASPFSSQWLEEDPLRLLPTASPALSAQLIEIAGLAAQDPDFQQRLNTGQSFAQHYHLNKQHAILTLTAIEDFKQNNIAYLVALKKSPSIASQHDHFQNVALVMSVILVIVGYSLWRIIRSSRARRQQSAYLENIHDTMGEGLYVTDLQGNITVVNDSAQKTLGYSEEELIGHNAHQLFHNPEPSIHEEDPTCPVEAAIAAAKSYQGELRLLKADNTNIWVNISTQPMIIDGELQGAVNVFTDITEHKVKEDALRISATAFETQDGIMITNPVGVILRVNQAFSRITGYESHEVVGQTPKILNSGRQRASFYETMWHNLKEDHFWQGEIWNRRKDGEIYLEWLTITAVLNKEDKITHYVANFSDISDRHRAQEKIQKLAFYDSLTQLPNRRLLIDRLEQAIRYTKRTSQCGALFFLDLDNFKTLNDTKGHLVGDMLLKEVAKRLQASVREVDTIARLGGDEFVVLLENLGECQVDAVQQSEKLALSILESFNAPFVLQDHSHHTSPSIGVEIVHPKNQDSNEILAHADLAMYQAKKQGRNTVRFFNPDMQVKIDKMAELQSDLRIALDKHGLELYYQPQVNQFGNIIGAEALIRWNHPDKGFISPAEFIPMAEASGLIIPLGDYVLQTACETLFAWSAHPITADIRLSVNVSAKQFADIEFVNKVKQALHTSGANPDYLKLELTESMMVKDVESTISTMNELRDIGVRFSMDDFGTGHSSLSYLKRLPLSQLKIDQSFIRDLTVDAEDAAIVKTIIAMSNTLKLEVVAEGVETVEQKEFLKSNRCFIYQGYLFSRPLPLQEFEDLVRTTQEIHEFDFELED